MCDSCTVIADEDEPEPQPAASHVSETRTQATVVVTGFLIKPSCDGSKIERLGGSVRRASDAL